MTRRFALNASVATASSFRMADAAMDATRPSRSLPSFRHGSQAYFWTTEWQQKERLADFDFLIGDVVRPKNATDLIRHLHEAADAEAD